MKYYLPFLFLILLGCKSQSLISKKEQTINVMGYAEFKVKPDLSIVSLNAFARADDKSSVIIQMNQMVDSVITGLKSKNIPTEEVVINDLNIYWNTIEEKEKEKKIEYSAHQTIEIKLKYDLNQIEKIIEIVRDIPRLNFNIGFDLSKPRKDSLANVVSRMAIGNADQKANNIAEAAGLKVVKILNITYQSSTPGGFSSFMKSSEDVSFGVRSMNRPNLQPREIVLSDNIQLTYLVRNK